MFTIMAEKAIYAGVLSEQEQALLLQVDERKDELIQLLKDLVSIDSRSYDLETFSDMTKIFSFVDEFMVKQGATSKWFRCSHVTMNTAAQDEEQTWPTLACFTGDANRGSFLQFCCHLDVVPFSEEKWDDGLHPLDPVVKDGRVYGRGTCDMKGGTASQMMAYAILVGSGIPINGKLQMLFVPDEEINGDFGAQFVVREYKDDIDATGTIISEPTGQPPIRSPAIIVGEKGHEWLKLKFYGSAGHGSMPKPKSNAINKVNRFIANWKRMALPKVKPPLSLFNMLGSLLKRFSFGNLIKAAGSGDGELDPYNEDGLGVGNFFKTTVSFTQIHAGTKVNVIPDICELQMDIRKLPGISTQEVMDSIAGYCTKLGFHLHLPGEFKNVQDGNKNMQKRPVDVELHVISSTPGTFVSPDNPFTMELARAFEDVYRVRAVYFFAPGSSDAVHLRAGGVDNVVLFGPTGSHTHDSNEYVEIEHLIKTCKVYLLLAYRMLCKKR